jgi:hypothetical protein
MYICNRNSTLLFCGYVFFNLFCYITKKKHNHHCPYLLVNDFQPVFYSKHADRFAMLKRTSLKVPQNSNIFNDVIKGVHNKDNPVVSPPPPC